MPCRHYTIAGPASRPAIKVLWTFKHPSEPGNYNLVYSRLDKSPLACAPTHGRRDMRNVMD